MKRQSWRVTALQVFLFGLLVAVLCACGGSKLQVESTFGHRPNATPEPTATPPPGPSGVTVQLSVNQSPIAYSTPATLQWNSTQADNCELKKNGDTTVLSTAKSSSGFTTGNHVQNETYTLTCSNTLGPGITSVNIVVSAPTNHFVFVSSRNNLTGNLGGLSGADTICKNLAVAANLRPDRPWKAILSVSGQNASTRIALAGPVFNTVDTNPVATAADFWSGTLQLPIRYDENKFSVNPGAGNDNVFTGTNTSGGFATGDCNGWSNTTGNVAGGNSSATNGNWINADASFCSNNDKRIYCISQ